MGATPKVTCTVKVHDRRITVTCKEAGSARDFSRSIRAAIAVSRVHDVYALRTGSLRRLVLHSSRRLHGRYVLTVEIRGYKPLVKRFRVR